MCRVTPMDIGSRQIRVAEIKQKYIQNIIDAAKECNQSADQCSMHVSRSIQPANYTWKHGSVPVK